MRNIEPNELDGIKRLLGGIPYTFHRKDGFYPLMLGSDDEARGNAECNPGTVRVVNEITKDEVWNDIGTDDWMRERGFVLVASREI